MKKMIKDKQRMEKNYFRSCFIADVVIADTVITLTDSSHNNYYIDIKKEKVVAEFKNWFKNIFTAGIAQTLTLFEYELVDVSECEVELFIVKFLNKNITEEK